jgi:vancomycin resistance protein VanW
MIIGGFLMPKRHMQGSHGGSHPEPVNRSKFRARLGKDFYGLKRRFFWLVWRNKFAKDMDAPLAHNHFQHSTPLLRQLNQLDMAYQYNKIVNLRIAVSTLDGLVLHPGEIFSYWQLIGNPTKGKGYLEGMVLKAGQVSHGVGGGLCQLSNLIYWMTLHTPLTIVERHRHGYDVFPDADRTQPFGSGATCSYPHIDLMIQNNTDQDFQLAVRVGEKNLEGAWRAEHPPEHIYQIIEKNHEIVAEYWGGYTRKNRLVRQTLDLDGSLVNEELVALNTALMMYEPFIDVSRHIPYSGS